MSEFELKQDRSLLREAWGDDDTDDCPLRVILDSKEAFYANL